METCTSGPAYDLNCHLFVAARSGGRDRHRGLLDPVAAAPAKLIIELAAMDTPSVALGIIAVVPRISEFYGIVIEMYYGDHRLRTSTPATAASRRR